MAARDGASSHSVKAVNFGSDDKAKKKTNWVKHK